MGEDGSSKNSNEWSLSWGQFINEEHGVENQSLILHKRLLDAQLESLHREIEELAVQLSHESRQSTQSEGLRSQLKELFIIEENLNKQIDTLNEKIKPGLGGAFSEIKGVS